MIETPQFRLTMEQEHRREYDDRGFDYYVSTYYESDLALLETALGGSRTVQRRSPGEAATERVDRHSAVLEWTDSTSLFHRGPRSSTCLRAVTGR